MKPLITLNNKVAIIAPASIPVENATEQLEQAVRLLSSVGFKVKFNNDIICRTGLPYFAAPRNHRLSSLREALSDPEISIIWAFRGGFGCSEIIFDCLNIKPTEPKTLVGFSDITALHFLFNQEYRLPTIHGSVLTSLLGRQSSMLSEISDILSGKQHKIELEDLLLRNSQASFKIDNPIVGKTTGGNLTLICNMIGTKLSPDFKDKILVLEEVNEKGYQIYRNLLHVKNAGLFRDVKAVIFGDFTKGDALVEESIINFCKQHLEDTPVFRACGIGHDVINHPIILGADCVIDNNKLIIPRIFQLKP